MSHQIEEEDEDEDDNVLKRVRKCVMYESKKNAIKKLEEEFPESIITVHEYENLLYIDIDDESFTIHMQKKTLH